jgi:hypothetical protein
MMTHKKSPKEKYGMACRACISCNPPNIAKDAHANQNPQTQAPNQKQEKQRSEESPSPKGDRKKYTELLSEKALQRSSPTQP